MTVEKHTFPQSGDGDYAENFSAHLGRSNISNYVEEGMDFTNLSGTSADVTKGKAFILTPSSGVADGSTRLDTDFMVHIPTLTVSLTDGDLNYIYLDPNVGTDDSPTVTAYTSTSNAGANDLLIGTIDTTTSPPTTTQKNRRPDVEFDRLRSFIDLGIPVYDDLTNAETGEGNVAFATGAGPDTQGVWFHDGTAWEYSGIQSLRDADVSGVTGLIEDTSGNRPTAGSEGRIFFESDTGEIKYDDGSAWQNLGVSKHSQLPDVTSSDHHPRYTDEEAQDAVNTLLAGGSNVGLTYSDSNNSLTVDVTPQGASSGLDADLLDGVELANIDWADVAMAQGDVNTSDLGVADSDIDMGGWDVLNGGTVEAEFGSLIQGADPRDSISESTSPKGFDFSGDAGRDIHGSTDVTITNGSSSSVSETITVELYDGTDTTGTLVTSESKSVSVAATTTKTITFIAGDVPLDNGTYHINITQSGTTLSIDKAVEHTKGGRYTLGQTATGDLYLDNQDGSRVLEVDAISENIQIPNGNLGLGEDFNIKDAKNNTPKFKGGVNGSGNSYATVHVEGKGSAYGEFWDGTNSQAILRGYEGGNVSIPNGSLSIDNSGSQGGLTVKSTNKQIAPHDTNSTNPSDNWQFRNANNDLYFLHEDASASSTTTALSILNNGNVEIPNGNLNLGQNIVPSSSRMDIYTRGNAGDYVQIRDGANASAIANFKQGGNVEIPNGTLNLGGNNVDDVADVGNSTTGNYLNFDESSSWVEVIDGTGSREQLVAQDVYINEDSTWVGDHISTDNAHSVGLEDARSVDNSFAGVVRFGGNLDTNGNYLNLDNGDQWLTIHDGNGNYNLKSGVDPNNTIVATSGGTHVQLAESGAFSAKIDSGTATGSAFSTAAELLVNGSGVHVASGGFVLPVGVDAWA